MGMIDISEKEKVPRRAVAKGEIRLSEKSVRAIKNDDVKKGNVFQVAEIAAVQAVKNTPQTLPHCHPVPIESVDVEVEFSDENILETNCKVKAIYKTGVEMEALAGVNAALLTVWDMVKYLEKDQDGQYPRTKIQNIVVTEKKKGEKENKCK